ncbi:MFS transporter [Planctomicrobium sp. SH661]|uniref:MFS transporter n=1 Tax=Planctomicrobium sp. SH661 TaxID=3448124 RepID=UPI003F5C03CD
MRQNSPAILLLLLILAVGISYVDRGSLSVVKTDLSREFGLDPAQMGLLFSAFFWTYATAQLAAGWLVDRYDVKWVYAIGFLIWSLATMAMGFAGSFSVMLILRLLLGAGESVAFPATSKLLAANFPVQRLGLANALVAAASKLGPAISLLLGGLVVAQWGWRSLFLTVGLGSLLWLPAWLWFGFSTPAKQEHRQSADPQQQVGFMDLLLCRNVWGTSLAYFSMGYVWAFLLFWLPAYLEETRGLSKWAMAVFGSLPFWTMAGTAICGGWLADWSIQRGSNVLLVRRSFLICGLLLCGTFMSLAMLTDSAPLCITSLTIACGGLGLYSSNGWALTQTLAGPAAAGRWTGLQNSVGNVGGALAPALTGWLVRSTDSYSMAFGVASLFCGLGVLACIFLIGGNVALPWAQSAQLASPAMNLAEVHPASGDQHSA